MAAAEGIFKGICALCADAGVERHPYHRNCNCALHRSRRETAARKALKGCAHGLPRSKTVSYPIKKSWSEGCLVLMASPASSPASSAQSSPAASPAVGPRHRRLSSLDEVAEEDCGAFFVA